MPAACGARASSARPATWHQNSSPRARAADPLHDALVGIAAAAVELGQDALAGALEFGARGVEHLEAAPDERVARGAEHLEQRLVAIDHQALARDHEPDRRLVECNAVIERCRDAGAAVKRVPKGLREDGLVNST